MSAPAATSSSAKNSKPVPETQQQQIDTNDNLPQKSLDHAVQGTNDDSILSKRSAVRHGYFKDPFVRYFTAKNPPRRSPMINRGYYIRMQVMETVVTTFLKRFASQVSSKEHIDSETQNDDNETEKNNQNTSPVQMLSLGAGFDTFASRNYNTSWLPPSSSDEDEQRQPFYGNFYEVDFPSVMKNKVALMEQAQAMYNQQQQQQQKQAASTSEGNDETTATTKNTNNNNNNNTNTHQDQTASAKKKKVKEIPEEFLLTPIPFGPNEASAKLVPAENNNTNTNKDSSPNNKPAKDNDEKKKESSKNNNKKKKQKEKKADGSSPSPTTGGDDIPTVCYSCDRYRCIGCDLRDLTSLATMLRKNGFDFNAPTVVYAECVTQYMPRDGSDALLKWVSLNLKNAVFIGYDQIRNDDAFGKQMVASLKSRLSPLLGTVSGLNNCETLLERATKTAASFRNARCVDFQQISNFILRNEELKRVQDLEPFDEFEEWYIQCRHYGLLIGLTKNAQPWFEDLIEDEIKNNLFFWNFSSQQKQQQQQSLKKNLPSDNPLLTFHSSSSSSADAAAQDDQEQQQQSSLSHLTLASRSSSIDGSWNAVSSFQSNNSSSSNNSLNTIIVSFGGNMACAARLQPHEKISPLFIFSVDPVSGCIEQIPVTRLKSDAEEQSITTNNNEKSTSFFPAQRFNATLTRIETNSELNEFIKNNTNFDDDFSSATNTSNNSSSSSTAPVAVFVLFGGRTSPASPVPSDDNTWLLVVHQISTTASSSSSEDTTTNATSKKSCTVSWIKITNSSNNNNNTANPESSIPQPRSRHSASSLIGSGKAKHSSSFAFCGGVDGKQIGFGDLWIGEVVVTSSASSLLNDDNENDNDQQQQFFRSPQRNYANALHQKKKDLNRKCLQMCWTELKFSSASQTSKAMTSAPSASRSAKTMSFFSPPKTPQPTAVSAAGEMTSSNNNNNDSSSNTTMLLLKPCVGPQFVVIPKGVSSPSSSSEDSDSETFFFFISGGLDLVTGRIHADNNFVGTVVAHQKIVPTSAISSYQTEKKIGSVDGPFRGGPASTSHLAKETLSSIVSNNDASLFSDTAPTTTTLRNRPLVEGKFIFRTFSAEQHREYSSSASTTINSMITPRFSGVAMVVEDLVAAESFLTPAERIQKDVASQINSSNSHSRASSIAQSATKHYHVLTLGGIFDDNDTNSGVTDHSTNIKQNKKQQRNFCEVVEIVVPPTSYKGVVFPRIERTFQLRLNGINNNSQQQHDEFISDFAKCNCIRISPQENLYNNNKNSNSDPRIAKASPIPPTTNLLFFGGSYNCFSFGSFSPKPRLAQLHWDGNSNRSLIDGLIFNPEFENNKNNKNYNHNSLDQLSSAADRNRLKQQQKMDREHFEKERSLQLDHERRLQEIKDAEAERKNKLRRLLAQFEDDEETLLENQRLARERERQLQLQRELAEDQLNRLREQGSADEERIRQLEEEMKRRRLEQERLMNEEMQVESHLKKMSQSRERDNDDENTRDEKVQQQQNHQDPSTENNKNEDENEQQTQQISPVMTEEEWDEITDEDLAQLSPAARRRLRKARDLFHSDQKVTKKDDRYFVSFGRTTRPKSQQETAGSKFGKAGSSNNSSGPSTPRGGTTTSSPSGGAPKSSSPTIINYNTNSKQQNQQRPSSPSSATNNNNTTNTTLGIIQLPPIKQINPNHIIPELNPKNLEKVVEKLRVPVVFRKNNNSTNAFFDTSKWSDPKHLIQVEGEKTVSVHCSPRKSLDFVKKNFKFKHVKFSELIEHCCDEKASQEETWYLRAVGENMRTERTNFWQQFKNLGKELVLPETLQSSEYLCEQKLQQSVFRVNQSGMQLWTHYDVCDNFLLHCAGPKRVTFFPPSMHHAMYVEGSSSKVIEIDQPDLQTYPKFLEARLQAFDVFLQPGDILFIPALWFHRIEVPVIGSSSSNDESKNDDDDTENNKNSDKNNNNYSISVNIFFEKLQHNVYDPKDLYGNKDLPSMTAGRAKVAKALKDAVAHVPSTEFKKFTLEQIIGDVLELEESLGK